MKLKVVVSPVLAFLQASSNLPGSSCVADRSHLLKRNEPGFCAWLSSNLSRANN